MSIDEIFRAHERIRTKIHKTPVITCSTIDGIVGRNVYFKCENLQKTGSFKARGALYSVLKLRDEDPTVKGVVTHSSGNHGQALAWAAGTVGLACTVVVPKNTPSVKTAAIKGYGADVVVCEPNPKDREDTCQRVADEKQQVIIPPFDHYDVIAGQGTIAIEFLEQVPDLDAILVPISGGGMTSGIALATKHIRSSAKVFAVEPEGKNLGESLRAGKRMWPNPPRYLNTVAEAIRFQQVGHLTFPLLCQYAEHEVFTVPDDEMIRAMKFTMQRLKMVIEVTSGAGVAAVMSDKMKAMDKSIKNVGVILCGGNVDLDALPW